MKYDKAELNEVGGRPSSRLASATSAAPSPPNPANGANARSTAHPSFAQVFVVGFLGPTNAVRVEFNFV